MSRRTMPLLICGAGGPRDYGQAVVPLVVPEGPGAAP
jgi:hypothetical protein